MPCCLVGLQVIKGLRKIGLMCGPYQQAPVFLKQSNKIHINFKAIVEYDAFVDQFDQGQKQDWLMWGQPVLGTTPIYSDKSMR